MEKIRGTVTFLIMFGAVVSYFKSAWVELKKVSWPTRERTIRLTVFVIVITLLTAAYLGILDYVFFRLMSAALKR